MTSQSPYPVVRKRKAAAQASDQDINVGGIADEASGDDTPARSTNRFSFNSLFDGEIENWSTTPTDLNGGEGQRTTNKKARLEERWEGNVENQAANGKVQAKSVANDEYGEDKTMDDKPPPQTACHTKQKRMMELMDPISELSDMQKEELSALKAELLFSENAAGGHLGWSNSGMLGTSHARLVEDQTEKQAEPHSLGERKIWPRREPLFPFLPERVLPQNRFSVPNLRINIPITEWNQDTSIFRNPPKHDRRRPAEGMRQPDRDSTRAGGKKSTKQVKGGRNQVFGAERFPAHSISTPNSMSARLQRAKLENEIWEARAKGMRHPQDVDSEYWSRRLAEEIEEEDTPGSEEV